MADYEVDYDLECPKCGHTPLHSEGCKYCGDIEGTEDLSDDDPIDYAPGTLVRCRTCKGHGIIRWCPGCGLDLTVQKVIDNSPDYDRW